MFTKFAIESHFHTVRSMLSVLIPTYNFRCIELAIRLSESVVRQHIPCEIIVCDDASNEEFKNVNRAIADLPYCYYLEQKQNLGRSRIRNFLATQAQGDWLLFLDCDGLPCDELFLQRYWQEAERNMSDVVCGGIVHPNTLPDVRVSLRYHYEKKAEPAHTVARRNQQPYAAFRSFNFMIRKEVFMQIKFDEAFQKYGYEDVLLGMQLKEKNIRIHHIDNPLINTDIEDNSTFLRKTEEALRTLAEQHHKLGNMVKLHSYYIQLKKWHLCPAFGFCFRSIRPLLVKNLMGKHPSVFFFNFYKLGYYTEVMNDEYKSAAL